MLNNLISRLNSLPRDSRDTLFLLAVIAWVLLPQTQHLPLWCSSLAAGVLVCWHLQLRPPCSPTKPCWAVMQA